MPGTHCTLHTSEIFDTKTDVPSCILFYSFKYHTSEQKAVTPCTRDSMPTKPSKTNPNQPARRNRHYANYCTPSKNQPKTRPNPPALLPYPTNAAHLRRRSRHFDPSLREQRACRKDEGDVDYRVDGVLEDFRHSGRRGDVVRQAAHRDRRPGHAFHLRPSSHKAYLSAFLPPKG